MNQGEAAKVAKVEQATWCDWENDVKRPDLSNVLMLVELTKDSKRFRVTAAMFTAKTARRKNPRGPRKAA